MLLKIFWNLMCTFGILILAGCRTPSKESLKPEQLNPPVFEDPERGPFRLPPRHRPLEDFERLGSLNVFSETGTPFLMKNTTQAIWGAYSAELRFRPSQKSEHTVSIVPEAPWRMPSLFDNLYIWIQDLGEGSAGGEHAIIATLRDADGEIRTVSLPYRPSEGWQFLQARLSESFKLPVLVEKLEWNLPEGTGNPRRIFLEGFTLYQEVLSRIPTRISYIRPFGYAPAFAPLRKNSVALNFPNSPSAFRPINTEPRHVVSLSADNKESYTFTSRSRTRSVSYRIRPRTAGPEIELKLPDNQWKPVWSGPRVETLTQPPEFRFGRIRDNELFLQYTNGVTYSLKMEGVTLMVSVETLREEIQGLHLGRLDADQTLSVPFMRTSVGKHLPVHFLKTKDAAVFLTVFPDWWFSMASEFRQEGTLDHVGYMSYAQRWRGSRNVFRERIYFTASDRIEDVLPTVASPPAIFKQQASTTLWPIASLRPHWLFNLQPTEREWQDSRLARLESGEWQTYPNRKGAVVKTALAEDIVLPRLSRMQDPENQTLLYLPETTAHGPWRFTDFDNRVVGAGTFAQTYAEMGALLQQAEAEWNGPLFGRGGAELFWAGLVSGFVPEFSSKTLWKDPWIPHLAWNSIRPASAIVGMGEISTFRSSGESLNQISRWLDRSIATQVVYGAVGRLPSSGLTDQERRHAAKLISAFQKAFADKTAQRIAYWDGNQFVSFSQVIRKGLSGQNQMYIRLSDQSELWVNGAQTETWERRVGDKTWKLPPFGLLFRGEDELIFHSPDTREDPRVTFIQTSDSTWVSSPQKEQRLGGLSLKGSLELRKLSDRQWKIEISQWEGMMRIDQNVFPFPPGTSVQGIDREGNVLSNLELVQENGYWILKSSAHLKTVWIFEEQQEMKYNLSR